MSLDWKMAVAILAAVALIGGVVAYVVFTKEKPVLLLATTTSTYDSGLLDYLLPVFEKEHECEVDVIAVGSGMAMELGKNGDVDVLLVHSPTAEAKFMEEGYGEERCLVMYNNYIVVGSSSDPADANDSANVTVAFKKIQDNGTSGGVQFLSRGDNSGTHCKELLIWTKLGVSGSRFDDWYVSTGLGMGDLLDMCEQQDASKPSYTLSDDATYYQRQSQNLIPHLKVVYNYQKTDSLLKNQYSVIVLNETRFPHSNHILATAFKDWLISQDGQDLIASYTKYGQHLFYPNAVGYTPRASSVDSWVSSADGDIDSKMNTTLAPSAEPRANASIWCCRWRAQQVWN